MDTLHLWNGLGTGEAAGVWVESHLEGSKGLIAGLLAVEGSRTVENTLVPFDRAQWHLRMAGSQAGVMFMVHPAAEVRDAVQELSQAVSAAGVELSLNQDVYKALAAVDASGEDAATKYYLERTLLGYRLAGVDRDEATREKVRALAEKMTELSMTFSRTVQDDVRKIVVDDAEELRGLPGDYLARHGVAEVDRRLAAAEAVVLTTDPPEMSPVMSYAASAGLRRKMYLAYNDRGYPANKQVLLDLLALRQEMAELLGFRSWADLATVDQMMGSAANMRKFLGEVEAAALEAAQHEFAELEAFVAERDPAAVPLTLSDARFWEEQFRRARFDFDSQSVRPYFPFEQVEAGILATAGKMFGVRFERDLEAAVWADGVKAFKVVDLSPQDGVVGTHVSEARHGPPVVGPQDEVVGTHVSEARHGPPVVGPRDEVVGTHVSEARHGPPVVGPQDGVVGTHVSEARHGPPVVGPQDGVVGTHVSEARHGPPVVGRIYLDMHPREGKSKWFSECSLVGGVIGHSLPEASLVCNFPEPKKDREHPEKDDPGLMQYSDVVTYFHEFGHLMHEVLGGRQRWNGQSGIATEGDFVEVPSQMLEEFFEDPELLRSFAKHYETGEPIPYETVTRMTRAAAHGRALSTLTQVMYATYSMETHDRATAELDLDALLREGYDRFSKYEFVDGNRMYAAFTHLVGYTSNYYTYLFDKVMALEFFAEFGEGFDGETAMRYRRQVLGPGGSKPARELVKDFLGREVSMGALRGWIAAGVER